MNTRATFDGIAVEYPSYQTVEFVRENGLMQGVTIEVTPEHNPHYGADNSVSYHFINQSVWDQIVERMAER